MRDPLDLSLDGLLEDARAATGLDDFGDRSFEEGLAVLLETYEGARLRPGGRKRTRARLLGLLTNRLKIERVWKIRPDVRDRPIRRPVYLTGLPRTGTSTLFNLLAQDAASRPLLLWEGVCPDPLDLDGPACESGTLEAFRAAASGAGTSRDANGSARESDPRMRMIQAALDAGRAKNADFDKIHFARADGPEECVLLLAHTFRDVQLGIEPLMQPYGAWFERQDLAGSYAYYADLLRLLDWQRPGERWLLKSPAHLWALDILVALFPDACVIQTHRDPIEVIPSYCSMMQALMSIRASVDPLALGPVVLEYLARSLERGIAARERRARTEAPWRGAGPHVRERSEPSAERDEQPASSRFLDVDYGAFTAAPLDEIARVYAHFGLALDGRTEAAMRAFLEHNPQGKHGAHRYSLEEYGLSAAAVRDRLRFYTDRFGVDGAT